MSEINDAWKTIRNFLRKTNPKTALETIRYYSLYSGTPGILPPIPPNYIEVPQTILSRPIIGIFPWDMEILAREVVYSATENTNDHRYDLRQWRHFGNLLEKLRELENVIGRTGINSDNVLLELLRISYRQFPHQKARVSKDLIVRYGKLFTYPEVAPIVLDKTRLPYEKIATIGIGFWNLFETYASIEHPTQGISGTNINKEDIEKFLALYSKSFTEMKTLINNTHKVDNTFLYQYNPLIAYPLVKFEELGRTTYVCTSVNRYASQITRGVYYMLYSDRRFDNAFGNAFEDYVGEVLCETVSSSKSYTVYSQETDPSNGKRRCDWIIDQGNDFIMIECKTKRMAVGGYTILDDNMVLIDQLSKLAEAVVQSYQGYLVYKGEGYSPSIYPHGNKKQASICVVTLEKWYLYGPPFEKLKKIIKDKLKEKNIDLSIINEVPYEVVGIDEFEKLAYLAGQGESIRKMFKIHAEGDESTHEFAVFMNDNYKDKLRGYNYPLSDNLGLYITAS